MGKTLADLQSNISISAENAVSGTLKWVEGYTGFSSNPAEQSGNYLALRIDAGGLEDATIVATYNGREVTLDSDQIIIVRHAEGEDTITFTATKEGYTTGVMTLDLSTLTFTPEPAKFSLVCNTPGITFAPNGQMAGGTATFEITATGQVPYDTTTSSNLINMTLTTNASPTYDQTDDSILVAYLDSQDITHTLYTGSLTWNDNVGTATFNCPITADSITYSPVIAIVVDGTNATRVSQVLDTSALTLQAAPSQVNVIIDTTKTPTLTLTPSTYSSTKALSGTVPIETGSYYLVGYIFTGSNIPALESGQHYYVEYFGSAGTRVGSEDFDSFTPGDPSYAIADMSYTAADFGTGKSISLKFSIIDSQDTVIQVLDTITIDTSASTLEAAPIAIITGDYLSLSNTTQITDSFGNTFNASDVIESAIIDSSTAGTSTDPWTVNIALKGYVPTGQTKTNYCMGLDFVKALSTINYNQLLENNTNKGNAGINTMEVVASIWDVSGTHTYAIPQTVSWNLKSTKTDPTTDYDCYITYYSDSTSYQNIKKYINFTVSVAT